jgi:hypothetical protein
MVVGTVCTVHTVKVHTYVPHELLLCFPDIPHIFFFGYFDAPRRAAMKKLKIKQDRQISLNSLLYTANQWFHKQKTVSMTPEQLSKIDKITMAVGCKL